MSMKFELVSCRQFQEGDKAQIMKMMMMMMIMIRMMMMTMLSTLRSLGPADSPASLQNSLPPRFNSCAAAVAKPSADRSRILAPQPQCTCNIYPNNFATVASTSSAMHWQSPVPSSKAW